MNSTLIKWAYPEALIAKEAGWAVLLRAPQITLGSLVICTLGDERALSELREPHALEMFRVMKKSEQVLANVMKFTKINYLCLMMVDPHVHLHVIPRYSSQAEFRGIRCDDSEWPKPPNFEKTLKLDNRNFEQLRRRLAQEWENLQHLS
jgi:diadenosine tetraphosphate (Ap4A) HIT family hydrolase